MEMRQLHEITEEKKEELVRLVEQHGLCHDKVLRFSQDIDELINMLIYTRELQHTNRMIENRKIQRLRKLGIM
ncbi:aspartyl-phosphate phosphatase Spo0E family protein [Bacillus sp. JJ1127]|uniref:aspartyl-phosphate phosphatase Spo0E family protein n=1 Tax=Bacillus sp. JJ1127 TaxID=3122952 RepID=UPI003F689F54